MDKKLKRGIFTVLLANIINVIFSLATNFLLPKYLSVEAYAGIKTFQLYVSYVGLLHFGYIDGMYLKYGGVDLGKKVDKGCAVNISTMRIFEITITAIITLIALLTRNWIIVLFAVSIFPQNIANYYKFLYQATGEFTLYGRVMNFSTIGTFAVNMFLLLLMRCNTDVWYIIFYVALYYLIWLILEIHFHKRHIIEKSELFSWNELASNIRDGFLLTLGNLASMMQTGMDRWFVKFLMTVTDFAQYSFAVSVENFLNMAITPITMTLYNYFCREKNEEKHRELTRYIFVFATILPIAAFPVKLILELFLQNYLSSTCVIFLLFAAQMFSIIIRSIFVNLYKVKRKQKIYFFKLLAVLVIGFIFNVVCFQIMHVKEAFAVGTLLSGAVWYIISVPDFKYLKISISENIYLILAILTFLLTGFNLESIIGAIVYLISVLTLLLIFMRPTLMKLIRDSKRIACKIVKI
jgi:O-antigen/teichoic acid export membrane protein